MTGNYKYLKIIVVAAVLLAGIWFAIVSPAPPGDDSGKAEVIEKSRSFKGSVKGRMVGGHLEPGTTRKAITSLAGRGLERREKGSVTGVLLDWNGAPAQGIPYKVIHGSDGAGGDRVSGARDKGFLGRTGEKGEWSVAAVAPLGGELVFRYTKDLSISFPLEDAIEKKRLFLPDLAAVEILCSGFRKREKWGFMAFPFPGASKTRWKVEKEVLSRSGPVLITFRVVGHQVVGGKPQRVFWLPGERLLLKFWGERFNLDPKEKTVVLPDQINVSSMGHLPGFRVVVLGRSGEVSPVSGRILCFYSKKKSGGVMEFTLSKGSGFVPTNYFPRDATEYKIQVLLNSGESFLRTIKKGEWEEVGVKEITFLRGTGRRSVDIDLGRGLNIEKDVGKVLLETGSGIESLDFETPVEPGVPWIVQTSPHVLRFSGLPPDWIRLWVVEKSGKVFLVEKMDSRGGIVSKWLPSVPLGPCDFRRIDAVVAREDYKGVFVDFQVQLEASSGEKFWVIADQVVARKKGMSFRGNLSKGSRRGYPRNSVYRYPSWNKFRPKGSRARISILPMGGIKSYFEYTER